MDKKAITAITLIAALIAIAAPILTAIYLANREARNEEAALSLSYARDVSERNEHIGDQAAAGIERLVGANAKDPCSNENIELMRQIAVNSSYLQAMAAVSRNRLICSSVGSFGEGLDIGPADYVSSYPAAVRTDVEFPFAKGYKFLVVEKNGYAAVIHKSLMIDWKTEEKDASLAAFSTVNGMIVNSRGFIKPEWTVAHPELHETTFFDGKYIVAVVRSKRYSTGVVVALPVAHVAEKTGSVAKVMGPVGTVAGIALAILVLLLGRTQLALPAVIKTALRRKEFYLVYQPIIELSTGKWTGAEALIRWRRRGGEMVGPDLFIPAAERAGLIERITERVMELIAQDAVGLIERYPDFHFSINLSAADLYSPRTLELLQQLIRDLKAGPCNLVAEVTERGLVKAHEGMEGIRKIRAAGICVAIDDFGTGYSSLSYLESFELDCLKIDSSFVKSVGTEAATSNVALHIIEMAKELKLKIIAEGVETEDQAQFLRDHGVHYAQGYLYARPMAFPELAAKLETTGT